MIQLKQSLTLKLSEDSGSNPQLNLTCINETSAIEDTLEESYATKAVIATGAVDQQIDLGTISQPQGLHIKSDQDIEIKLNNTDGTDRSLTLKANLPSLLHAEYSALYVSNSSGNEACVRIVAWGVE